MDGSAFSLYGRPSWDPSIPAEKARRQTSKTAADGRRRTEQQRTAEGGNGTERPWGHCAVSSLVRFRGERDRKEQLKSSSLKMGEEFMLMRDLETCPDQIC